MTTCPICSKPLGKDRFCIGPLTAPHPAVYPKSDAGHRKALDIHQRLPSKLGTVSGRGCAPRDSVELGRFLRNPRK